MTALADDVPRPSSSAFSPFAEAVSVIGTLAMIRLGIGVRHGRSDADHCGADDHGQYGVAVEDPGQVRDGHDRGAGHQRYPAAEAVDHGPGHRRERHHGQARGDHRQVRRPRRGPNSFGRLLQLLGADQHVGHQGEADQDRSDVGQQNGRRADVRRSTSGWLTFSE